MKPSSQRAVVWLLSVVAVLAPAAGIAVLGAVSYRGERGAVADRIEQQLRVAQRVAARVEQSLARAIDEADRALAAGARPDTAALAQLAVRHPLARAPFLIDADGALVWPPPAPLGGDTGDDLARAGETCAERGLEACIRDAQTTRQRDAQLAAARNAEVDGRRGEARRGYQALARFDDSGPEARLALARLARLAGDRAGAEAHLRAIERDFRGGRVDGVPLEVVVALARAELAIAAGDARPALALYRALIERRHGGPPAALVAIAERLAAGLHGQPLGALERADVAILDEQFAAARAAARRARALAPDTADLARAATADLAGRPSLRDPSLTIAFRRSASGAVVGLVVDSAALAAAAATSELAAVARGARASVSPVGAARSPQLRILAAVPLGAALPHLTLAVVNDRADPDPLDDVIRKRSRRHLLVSGGLALVLTAGILATFRGATRERELARLKSDFVSTV